MNKFLKNHILAITGDLYPTVQENKILEVQIVDRIRGMEIPNPDFYKASILLECIFLKLIPIN